QCDLMIRDGFPQSNASRIFESLRGSQRPRNPVTQSIAVIIADDFRAGLSRCFRILPFAGGASLALGGRDFGTVYLYFRVPRKSFRDQRVERTCVAAAANNRREHICDADCSKGFPNLGHALMIRLFSRTVN